jgi:DNA methyltransferase 1-associated protein 1
MSSLDVRDMLDLPSSAGPRPAKKQKIAGPRPNLKGLQREVQSLKGDNPIAIVPEIPQFKKRRFASRKAAAPWVLQPFKTTTREDGLVLKHWRRKPDMPTKTEGEESQQDGSAVKEEPVEDSIFAKYNVQIQKPTYSDEQYESNLKHPDWSREETDYLVDLTAEYDLRWTLIWDRYDYKPPAPSSESIEVDGGAVVAVAKPRSMEDLKARYYQIAAKMFSVNRPINDQTTDEFAFHESMLNFDPVQETARKRFVESSMNRSDAEKREEELLLVELKRIVNRAEQLDFERRELYARLETPPSTSSTNQYTNSNQLHTLLQSLLAADKNKRKRLMPTDGASPGVSSSNQHQTNGGDPRRDSSQRDTIGGASAANAKKGPAGPNERRKLSDEEQTMYGVSHHERLTGGPSFRGDKINKLMNFKSATHAHKLTLMLAELGIPARLVMPTVETLAEFEALIQSLNALLDTKKLYDKVEAEIKLVEAQKIERETRKEQETKEKVTSETEVPAKEENGGTDTAESVEPKVDAEVQPDEEPQPEAEEMETKGRKRSASVLSDKSSKRQKK